MLKHLVLSCLLFVTAPLAAHDLIVMRHAEGRHNVELEHNSNPEHPNYKPANLTSTGQEQALKSAMELYAAGYRPHMVSKVLVSPLPRTMQTAQMLVKAGVIHQDQIQVEQRLIEVNEGEREGTNYPAGTDNWDRSEAASFGGETTEQVQARVGHLLAEVQPHREKGHVILVTHGTPARELDEKLANTRDRLGLAGYKIYPSKASADKTK